MTSEGIDNCFFFILGLADYTSTTSSTTNVTFTSSSANDTNARRMCVSVFITDDQILEGRESFTLQLVFAAPAMNVMLEPNVTQIFITDDDGRCGITTLLNK